MNSHQFETTCSICGGGGVSTMRDAGSQWYGGSLAHTDPRVCSKNLAAKQQVEEKTNQDIPAQDRAVLDADDEYMFEQLEKDDDS